MPTPYSLETIQKDPACARALQHYQQAADLQQAIRALKRFNVAMAAQNWSVEKSDALVLGETLLSFPPNMTPRDQKRLETYLDDLMFQSNSGFDYAGVFSLGTRIVEKRNSQWAQWLMDNYQDVASMTVLSSSNTIKWIESEACSTSDRLNFGQFAVSRFIDNQLGALFSVRMLSAIQKVEPELITQIVSPEFFKTLDTFDAGLSSDDWGWREVYNPHVADIKRAVLSSLTCTSSTSAVKPKF